jgi:transcriptional regulator with XRE-family HTH domain
MGTENKRFEKAFKQIGERYRARRRGLKMVQEQVLDHGFSVRHYQQLEAGRPHGLTTLFRLAELFQVHPAKLIDGIVLPAGGRKTRLRNRA